MRFISGSLSLFLVVFATLTHARPNPASENCIAQGGSISMRRTAQGSEYGICAFFVRENSPNDTVYTYSECEEFALLRGDCAKGSCTQWLVTEDQNGRRNSRCYFPSSAF